MLNQVASDLLLAHLDLLAGLDRSLPMLDLACGTGRDGDGLGLREYWEAMPEKYRDPESRNY